MNSVLAFVIVSSMLVGCKAKQETAKQPENKSSESKAISYRVIVSFISKGSGFDAPKKNAFMSYVNNHPKKPVYKSVLWGMEGEIDYCFTLSELSAQEQTDFVTEMKNKMSGSDLVFVSENSECKHFAR